MLKSPRNIVTSGSAYTDIDALACSVAYAELLRLIGKEAVAVLTAPLNSTVTDSIRSWSIPFEAKYKSRSSDQFILVDISNPEHFETFVDENKVIQVFDHHYGHECFWREKLSKNALIEDIGSCATLIWEQFKTLGKANNISAVSANLIYSSIISNTLNLKASITNKRDLDAKLDLEPYISLPKNWIDLYYSEVESKILIDPIAAIRVDTKRLRIRNASFTIAQLELWNADKLLEGSTVVDGIVKHLATNEGYWFLSVANIKKGCNFIITSCLQTQNLLASVLVVKFEGNLGTTDKLFLRKEFIKIFMDLPTLPAYQQHSC